MLAEADAQQAFIDVLAKDVIKPLEKLKVSRGDPVLKGISVLIVRHSGRKRGMNTTV